MRSWGRGVILTPPSFLLLRPEVYLLPPDTMLV